MTVHRCHAKGCPVPCAPELLMCSRHWNMVPFDLQQQVWRTYRPGQCDDKQPSAEWHVAADKAIAHVHEKELAMMRPFANKVPLWAITVHQPWAQLIAHGHKTIENRDWVPPSSLMHAWIAIHAGKTYDLEGWKGAAQMARDAGVVEPFIEKANVWFDKASHMSPAAGNKAVKAALTTCVPYGSIVALARITNVIDEHHLTDQTRPWFIGPFAWVLESVVHINPIACPGKQGFWRVEDASMLEKIRADWRAARGARDAEKTAT